MSEKLYPLQPLIGPMDGMIVSGNAVFLHKPTENYNQSSCWWAKSNGSMHKLWPKGSTSGTSDVAHT